jgi:hypothetical protein
MVEFVLFGFMVSICGLEFVKGRTGHSPGWRPGGALRRIPSIPNADFRGSNPSGILGKVLAPTKNGKQWMNPEAPTGSRSDPGKMEHFDAPSPETGYSSRNPQRRSLLFIQ